MRRRVFYVKLERDLDTGCVRRDEVIDYMENLFPVWCERRRAGWRVPGSVWSDDMRNRCEICRHRSKRQTQSADLPRCEKPKGKGGVIGFT